MLSLPGLFNFLTALTKEHTGVKHLAGCAAPALNWQHILQAEKIELKVERIRSDRSEVTDAEQLSPQSSASDATDVEPQQPHTAFALIGPGPMWDKQQRVYVRQVYEAYYQSILQQAFGESHAGVTSESAATVSSDEHSSRQLPIMKCGLRLAVTGVPGIGKSMFRMYVVWRWAQERPGNLDWIVVTNGPSNSTYNVYFPLSQDQSSGAVFCGVPEVEALQTIFGWQQNSHQRQYIVLYLVDGKQELGSSILGSESGALTLPSCIVLWTCSPKHNSFTAWTDKLSINQTYFPVWTHDEVIDCWRTCYSTLVSNPHLPLETVQKRFIRYGGVARPIFADDTSQYERKLEKALNELAADIIVLTRDSFLANTVNAQCLCHTDDGHSYYWASLYVRSEVIRRMDDHQLGVMIGRAAQCIGMSADWCYFEGAAHALLARGCTLMARELKQRKRSSDQLDTAAVTVHNDCVPVLLPRKQHTVTFGTGSVRHLQCNTDTYFQPIMPNFPAFDSFTTEGCFQMTMSPQHPETWNRIANSVVKVLLRTCDEMREGGKESSRCSIPYDAKKQKYNVPLYFIVPEHIFRDHYRAPQRVHTGSLKLSYNIQQYVAYIKELSDAR